MITSTLLTLIAAVPFLRLAAPKAAKLKKNTTSAPAATSTSKPKVTRNKNHVKKGQDRGYSSHPCRHTC